MTPQACSGSTVGNPPALAYAGLARANVLVLCVPA